MTIAICASIKFLKRIAEVESKLQKMGFEVFVPHGLTLHREHKWSRPKTVKGRIEGKIKHDFIRKHFQKIAESNAILVLNYTKGGVKNYIGPNTFLEIGVAYFLGKKIFLLNPIPKSYLWEEVSAMHPVILHNKLSLLYKYEQSKQN